MYLKKKTLYLIGRFRAKMANENLQRFFVSASFRLASERHVGAIKNEDLVLFEKLRLKKAGLWYKIDENLVINKCTELKDRLTSNEDNFTSKYYFLNEARRLESFSEWFFRVIETLFIYCTTCQIGVVMLAALVKQIDPNLIPDSANKKIYVFGFLAGVLVQVSKNLIVKAYIITDLFLINRNLRKDLVNTTKEVKTDIRELSRSFSEN